MLKACGPFNEEGITCLLAEGNELLVNPQVDSWHRLKILDDEMPGSPEVMAKVDQRYCRF